MTRASRGLLTLAVLVGTGFSLVTPAYAVDGVILIDQNRALAGGVTPGDAPGFPVSIKRGGSYRLSGTLTVPDVDTSGISIETFEPLSIDLNGFAIMGPHTGGPRDCFRDGTTGTDRGSGIVTGGVVSSKAEIRNGAIERMGCDGIFLLGFGNSVQNVRVRGNGRRGIAITGLIANNIVNENGGTGITSFDAVVTGNQVFSNDEEGIAILDGIVSNNTVRFNTGLGLFAPGSVGAPGTRVGYSNNVFLNNNQGGAQVFGGVQLGSNLCAPVNSGSVCP